MNVEEFIQKHENTSIAALSLILSKKENIPKDFIINQINGRRKAKTKFPSLSKLSTYIFPSPRAIEQASSEQAATYKSELVGGKKMADLSGGMGLDSYFFAKQFESVDYIEQDSELCETSRQNFKALAANNIHCFNQNAVDFLKLNKKEYDLIYIDPDRRAAKHKAFLIDDCEPNLKELLPLIWKCTNYCLIKLSPMLDIKQALTELKFCKKVHRIAF